MEASRQQLQACRANQGPRPVLEEFIPLKHSTSEGSEKSSSVSDKANWMTSAQLWSSQASDGTTKAQSTLTSPKEADMGFHVTPKLALDNKLLQRNNGGAFLPFSKVDRNSSSSSPTLRSLPELALVSTDKDLDDNKCLEAENNNGLVSGCRRSDNNSVKIGNGGGGVIEPLKGGGNGSEGQTNNNNISNATSSQSHRKARRCWSPELHRKFVNALQMLGGSQGTYN